MADLAKIILPSGDEYNFKDTQAREHIQDHNNPHQVTAEQAGAVPESELDGETSTVTGDVVTYEPESAQILPSVIVDIDPVQDLHGYDHPWPAGGGKNLLPISATASSQYWTNNNDGSWTVNNSSTGSADIYPSGTTKFMSMGVLPAGTYTASAFSSRETLSDIVTVRIGKGANSTFLISAVGSVHFEADGTSEYWFAMLISASQIVSNHRVWLQCEKASAATSFAPYSNICPISGWDGCTVKRTGKNLFLGWANIRGNYATSYRIPVDFTSNTYYTISGLDVNHSSWVFAYDNNNARVGRTAGQHITTLTIAKTSFINGEGTKDYDSVAYIVIEYYNWSSVTRDEVEALPTQLEFGSTATTYEPCQSSTYSISFPSSAGTVYSGTLDVTNGLLTVDGAMVDMGTLDWNAGSGAGIFWIYSTRGIALDWVPPASDNNAVEFICSKYQAIPFNEYNAKASGIWWHIGSGEYIGFRDPNYVNWTTSNVKSDLSGEMLIARLKSPIIYQLTPTQITAFLGQNNLWADTGDVSVVYREGKNALLQDIADAVHTLQPKLLFDTTPIEGSTNPVTSGGIKAALDTKVNQSQLATVETGTTASQAYSAGDYFCMNGLLYKVTTAISSGQIFTPGTNCAVVTGGLSSEMQPKLVFDGVPTHLSSNPVSSDGLYSAITAVPTWYQGVDLTTVFATEIASSPYNGDPWVWIKARITDGDWHGLHIGDYIPFTTTEDSPKTYQAQIAGINIYKNYGDTAVGNHIDFICRELWATRHPMTPVKFNNGTKFGDAAATEYPWLASDLYLYLNSLVGKVPNATTVGGGTGTDVNYTSGGVYYYLPAALKAQIVEKRMYLPKRYSASSVLTDDNSGGWTYIGKLWFPSEFEVYGAPVWGGKGGYATAGNNIQYPLFAHNMNRVKNRNGGAKDDWWLLSVVSGSTSTWCRAGSNGEASTASILNPYMSFSICFRIA